MGEQAGGSEGKQLRRNISEAAKTTKGTANMAESIQSQGWGDNCSTKWIHPYTPASITDAADVIRNDVLNIKYLSVIVSLLSWEHLRIKVQIRPNYKYTTFFTGL